MMTLLVTSNDDYTPRNPGIQSTRYSSRSATCKGCPKLRKSKVRMVLSTPRVVGFFGPMVLFGDRGGSERIEVCLLTRYMYSTKF